MKLTVLGNCGPYPRAGGACSGYLLEDDNYKILIDCGNGTLSRLLSIINHIEDIDTIILSHLHSDHISDVMVLRYALGINIQKGLITKSIPLYAPNEPEDIYNKIQFKNAFQMNILNSSTNLSFGDLNISFKLMEHPIDTYSVIAEKKGKKFVYTSDTKYCNTVLEIANDADLLLCECNLLEKDRTDDSYHLSAKQVGNIASASNVKKLLITHLWPEYCVDDIVEEVRKEFDGNVEIAREFKTYEI